jgi:carboxylesterase type B
MVMKVSKKLVVPTTSGDIRGAQEKDVLVFRGVPYAAPPVGTLRPSRRRGGEESATQLPTDRSLLRADRGSLT